jgi:hypothetical protein
MRSAFTDTVDKVRPKSRMLKGVHIILIALGLLLPCLGLDASETQIQYPAYQAIPDSTGQSAAVLKARMLKDYHNYRLGKPLGIYSFEWLHGNLETEINDRIRILTESDLYILSYELYSDYYDKPIELYNLNGTAFLYLNLKDAQNKHGALQFKVNLPDMDTNFWKKPRL